MNVHSIINEGNPRIVPYPIPGNENGGRIFIYGLEQKRTEDVVQNDVIQHVLFFCGGFPDHYTTFVPLAQRFISLNDDNDDDSKNNRRVICGVCCLPGYDTHTNEYKTSYTFDEMTRSLYTAYHTLQTTIQQEQQKNNINYSKIIVSCIFHDWGSYVGSMFVNRLLQETSTTTSPNDPVVSNIVYFDVLPPAHPKLRIARESFRIMKSCTLMAYTLLFALCNTIQTYISFLIAAPITMVGYSILFILGLLPINWIDYKTFHNDRPKEYTLRKIIYMQYPYYELWRGIIQLGPKQFIKTILSDATLPYNNNNNNNKDNADDTDISILYMYGNDKRVMFHDTNVVLWLQQQQQQKSDQSRKHTVVSVSNAGHWLYRQQEDICYETISKFIGL